MLKVTEKQFKAFWAKVNVSEGCWEWEAALYSNGYGHFVINGKDHLAHKVSFQLAGGIIPEGLLLRHSCDNRKCVRPDHLIPGAQSNNIQDCIERGRLSPGKLYGEENAASVLTAAQVKEIKVLLNSKLYTQTAIAKKFGVSISVVNRIKLGKTWVGV